MNPQKRIVIVGFGAAGILCLHNLVKACVPPETICIIDPHLNGGDLQNKWPNVRSNTVWRQIWTAVQPSAELTALPEPLNQLDHDAPCLLRYIIQYVLLQVQPFLHRCELHSGWVEKYTQTSEGGWRVYLRGAPEPIQTDVLLKCTGSEPKVLDLPYPVIPLEVALHPSRLSEIVQKGQHVFLFGTAHSSTLIVQHLVDLGVHVTNIYATPQPFYFARDGAYDGIKQDAAEIADKILRKELPNVELVKNTDIGTLLRKSRRVDHVIYACGFTSRDKMLSDYDGQTGQIKDVQNAWGFGIAYPNQAPDGQHWDVSVPAFQAHIAKQLPNILSSLGIEAIGPCSPTP